MNRFYIEGCGYGILLQVRLIAWEKRVRRNILGYL